MKIVDRKEIDANLITGIHILQRQFGCKLKTVYAYKVELQDGSLSALFWILQQENKRNIY